MAVTVKLFHLGKKWLVIHKFAFQKFKNFENVNIIGKYHLYETDSCQESTAVLVYQ